jgi:hypothetical protein
VACLPGTLLAARSRFIDSTDLVRLIEEQRPDTIAQLGYAIPAWQPSCQG